MAYVIRGLLNRQIAAELGSGEKTVKAQRAQVMSKMLARSVPELVQLGARAGVEMQPYLGIGSMALRWREPYIQSSKRFKCKAPRARAADRAGTGDDVFPSHEGLIDPRHAEPAG